MNITDVYNGTLGVQLLNRREIILALNTAIISLGHTLSYDIPEGRISVNIITGANPEEQEIPSFTQPLVYTDHKGNTAIACDLRPYVKHITTTPVTVAETLADKYNGKFLLYRTLITKAFLDDDTDWYVYSSTEVLEIYTTIISTIVSALIFETTEVNLIKVMTKLHYLTLNEDVNDGLTVTEVLHRLPKSDLIQLTSDNNSDHERIKAAADKLIYPSTTMSTYIHNLQAVLSSPRIEKLHTDILTVALSKGFFSLTSKDIAIAFMEDIPTIITMLIMVEREPLNKKSSFHKILDKNKRALSVKDVIANIMKGLELEQ